MSDMYRSSYSTASPQGIGYAPYRGSAISLEFEGLGELIGRFNIASDYVRRELASVITDVSREGVKLAVATLNTRRAPFDSGGLIDSVRVVPTKVQGTTISGGYGAFIFYAYWVEHGRGAVRPVRARVLSWIDRWSGERKFARFVGPAAPRPFLEPTIQRIGPFSKRRTEQAATAITAYIAGYGGMTRGDRAAYTGS